jgi:hypothetical protein
VHNPRKADKMSLTQWALVALVMAIAGLITCVMYIGKGIKNFRFWLITSIGYVALETTYFVYRVAVWFKRLIWRKPHHDLHYNVESERGDDET